VDCPICDKVEAFEEDYDFCNICGWQSDPFMSNEVATVKFFDCNGEEIPAPEGIGGKWSSPNHCDSIADAKKAWSKYKTKYHFNKDKAPLTAEERMEIRIARRHIKPRKETSQKYTEEEHNRAFKCFFGIDRKKEMEKEN